MVRLKRAKLEVVVPAAQGQKYRPADAAPAGRRRGRSDDTDSEPGAEEDDGGDEETGGKKTKVEWVEDIVPRPARRGRSTCGWAWAARRRVVLHARELRAVPGRGDAPAAGGRAVAEGRPAAEGDPRAEGARPGDGQRALPGRRLPLPGRAAVRGVPACADRDLWDRIPRRRGPLPPRPSPGGRRRGGHVGRAVRGHLQAAGGGPLPLRRGQERAGGRAGQGLPLAGVAGRGDAADVPRPPAGPRRQPHRAVLVQSDILPRQAWSGSRTSGRKGCRTSCSGG